MTEREKKLVEALKFYAEKTSIGDVASSALAEFEAAEKPEPGEWGRLLDDAEFTLKRIAVEAQYPFSKWASELLDRWQKAKPEPSQDRRVAREWWAIIMPPAKGDAHSAALLYWEKPQHGAIKGLCTRIREVLDSDQPIRTFDEAADREAMEKAFDALEEKYKHVLGALADLDVTILTEVWSAALKHYGIGGGE